LPASIDRRGRIRRSACRRPSCGIDTAIYYPTPLHLQPALAGLGGRPGLLPRAEAACGEVLAVPANAELTGDEVARVCDEVRSFFLT